jgi:hypothetical protein
MGLALSWRLAGLNPIFRLHTLVSVSMLTIFRRAFVLGIFMTAQASAFKK